MKNRNDAKDSGSAWDDALLYAMGYAADSVEEWEFGGAIDEADLALHRRAALEIAKRIRRMASRYEAARVKREVTVKGE